MYIWESDTLDIHMDINDIQSSRFHGYPTPHMDIHMDIHSDFSIKLLTFWISWISIWIITGITTLISGYPFGYPILTLDFQFELWISKPMSMSNLWLSTRYPMLSKLIMDILLNIKSFLLDIQFEPWIS